jgi:hypothetical protein
LLGPATSTVSSMHPPSTVAVPVVVRLRDDLANSCKPGDFVTCTGIAECVIESKSLQVGEQGRPVLAEVRVEALHVLRHPPAVRISHYLPEEAQSLAFGKKQGSLSALVGAVKSWLHPPCCSLALAALLLSASSASLSSPPPLSSALATQEQLQMFPDSECDTLKLSNSKAVINKNQRVNILFLTGGHDTLESSLRSIAHTLCAHVTEGSLSGSALLPTVLDIPGVPSLASVGNLAQANSGVCLLTQTLSIKQGRAVGEALRSGHATVALAAGKSCTVDIHPTLWCLSAAPDLVPKQQQQQQQQQQQPAGKKFKKWDSGIKGAVAPLAVLFAEKSSPQLAAQFDVIIDCSSIEDDAAEACSDEYLSSLLLGGERRDAQDDDQSSKIEAARLALQSHIATCQQLPQPIMTHSAIGLLKSYWTATRAATAGDRHGRGGAALATSLETAAKLAAASARLFHRSEILDFPDATLAIVLCEEGLIARGWGSEQWGPLREQMAYGRDLVECLTDFYRQLLSVAKQHGWQWEAQEE